jgi:hypothetical protein
MWTRLLIGLLVICGVWYYFNQKKAPPPQAGSTGATTATSGSGDCYILDGRANASLASAISAASRPPVDAAEWSRVEGDASSAISAAESACGGLEPAMRALSLMRLSLTEIAAGARGEGGTMGVAGRQGEIDDLLNRARGR